MRQPFAIAVAAGLFAAPALAQEAPKPGPEHARLAYLAGTWRFDGESKDTPMGPGGKLSGTDTCEWFAGGFQLVCRGDMTGPRGAVKSGSIWAYDPAQRVYTLYGFNSLGEAFHVTGTVAGKVWTWMAEFPVEGASMKMKATVTEESATAYAYRLEMSADGTTWMVVEEGRATKRSQ